MNRPTNHSHSAFLDLLVAGRPAFLLTNLSGLIALLSAYMGDMESISVSVALFSGFFRALVFSWCKEGGANGTSWLGFCSSALICKGSNFPLAKKIPVYDKPKNYLMMAIYAIQIAPKGFTVNLRLFQSFFQISQMRLSEREQTHLKKNRSEPLK